MAKTLFYVECVFYLHAETYSQQLFPPKSKVSNSRDEQNEHLRIIKESIEEDQKGKERKKSWISEKTYGVLRRKVKALRQNDSEKI